MSYLLKVYFPGAMDLMEEDLKKPVEERYIYGITTTIHGGRSVIPTSNVLCPY
jgi:hypothetical protein